MHTKITYKSKFCKGEQVWKTLKEQKQKKI